MKEKVLNRIKAIFCMKRGYEGSKYMNEIRQTYLECGITFSIFKGIILPILFLLCW